MDLLQRENANTDKLRKYAAECMVLLKRKGDFPLHNTGKLALYGNGARNTIKGGTGSGDVNCKAYTKVEEGLEKAGFTITTKEWLDAYDKRRIDAKNEFIAEIKKRAKEQHVQAVFLGMGAVMPEPEYCFPLNGEGDTAIYVLSRISGEGNDRKPIEGDIKLTKTEIRDILDCHKQYAHFMLVLNVGGVIDLSPVLAVENILLMSQLGVVGGDALADVVLGKSYPSGKLTTTWSAWGDYSTVGNFGEQDDTIYREGIYVGYRYFDSVGLSPLFPFGFGLSYTDFSLEGKEVAVNGNVVKVSAKVTNRGVNPGKEVVQIYVTVPWGKLDNPYQKLVAFAKTKELEPGESETMCLLLQITDLSVYDAERAAYVLEPGKYIIRIGADSRNTDVCGALELDEDMIVRQLTNVKGTANEKDWVPEHTWKAEIISPATIFQIDREAVLKAAGERTPKEAEPDRRAKEYVEKLPDEDLCLLCVGSYKDGAGIASVIGSASKRVAGAARESYDGLASVPSIVMADGPAGLRLSQQYVVDKKGIHAIGEVLSEDLADFLPGIAKKLYNLGKGNKKKPKGEIHYQYCTAIPIGTAIAQSFNLDVAEFYGDLVGGEMERFGVHLWLAPAFNIHRSPLCGRNYEYFSEDPLVSGLMGSAITRGVQGHPGKGVTVKHFCCNNQETNRYQSNSIVSERALREIYLKAFEICIRESNPMALMTSYNLLNGQHTSERRDLLVNVLRKEWGWSGLVMSDWILEKTAKKDSKYRGGQVLQSVKGGNDLFMPGSSGDYKALLTALKKKNPEMELKREDVEYCAAHVVETAWKVR